MWHNLDNFSFASLNEMTEQVNCFYFSKACYWQLLHNQHILWQENVTILLYVLIYCANKYNSHTHKYKCVILVSNIQLFLWCYSLQSFWALCHHSWMSPPRLSQNLLVFWSRSFLGVLTSWPLTSKLNLYSQENHGESVWPRIYSDSLTTFKWTLTQ